MLMASHPFRFIVSYDKNPNVEIKHTGGIREVHVIFISEIKRKAAVFVGYEEQRFSIVFPGMNGLVNDFNASRFISFHTHHETND